MTVVLNDEMVLVQVSGNELQYTKLDDLGELVVGVLLDRPRRFKDMLLVWSMKRYDVAPLRAILRGPVSGLFPPSSDGLPLRPPNLWRVVWGISLLVGSSAGAQNAVVTPSGKKQTIISLVFPFLEELLNWGGGRGFFRDILWLLLLRFERQQ